MHFIKGINCKRNHNFLTISWENPDHIEVSVYWNARPEQDGNEMLVAKVTDAEFTMEDPLPGRRVYFAVCADGYQCEVVGERELPMLGTCNFRDLGGYPTADGRRVRWGLFYRSGALHALIPHDYDYVRSLGIDTIFDWRSEGISQAEPDDEGVARQVLNISAMPMIDSTLGGVSPGNMLRNPDRFKDFGSLGEIMEYGYRDMVFDSEAFRAMVAALRHGDVPFLQHCESGKDRAGMGSALLLLILGVPMEVVRDDYVASNRFIGICNTRFMEKLSALLDTEEKLEQFSQMMQVSANYLDSAFGAAIGRYGSIEAYLEAEYGLGNEELASIRDKYLF